MPVIDPEDTFVLVEASMPQALVVRSRNPLPVENLLGGSYEPKGPLRFESHLGRKPCDLMATGYAGLYLISEQLYKLLVNGGFTGWKIYSVEVFRRNGELLPGYFGWSITGRCGSIDESKSASIITYPKHSRGRSVKMLKGLVFDPSSWDGSDIFLSHGGGRYPFCTHRVARAIKDSAISNVNQIRSNEYMYPEIRAISQRKS